LYVHRLARITHLDWQRLDVPLNEPFGIATGAQTVAENLVLELGTNDGVLGLGEAAPFPAVSGETRADAERSLEHARESLLGLEVETWRETAVRAKALLEAPSALCAFETALLDAFTKRAETSLCEFFGGAETVLRTDITLTTGNAEQARSQAARASAQGFTTLKIKIGGVSIEHDTRRIFAAAEAAPETSFVLDANASLTGDGALELLRALGNLRERVALFEQPTAAGDLSGLRLVRSAGVRVAADESVRDASDVQRLAAAEAVDVVNLKIMKAGLVAALDAATAARSAGLGLMIGGMVETRLSMSASACLAGGLGGFSFVDLDTPFFLAWDPFEGGCYETAFVAEDSVGPGPHRATRPVLDLGGIRLGHGVRRRNGPGARAGTPTPRRGHSD
jgi:L-alanine-DL-glutamate epimerase-like enolase superfamily enzyme